MVSRGFLAVVGLLILSALSVAGYFALAHLVPIWQREQVAAHQNPILAQYAVCIAIRNCRIDSGRWPDSQEHVLRLGGSAPAYQDYATGRLVPLARDEYSFTRISTAADGETARYDIQMKDGKPHRCDLRTSGWSPHWVR